MRAKLCAAAVLGLLALMSACGGVTGAPDREKPPEQTYELSAINHIIILVQENRSFDHYFGHLGDYRVARGLPREVDGAPDDASNPDLQGQPVSTFHLSTVCTESQSPAWNESHRQWNVSNPTSPVGTMDGFVVTAAGFAQSRGLNDTRGVRVMGYYTDREIPFYYAAATEFATSDRFFASVLSQTPPNRSYMFSATSAGMAKSVVATLEQKTIFHLLEERGISWKIYTANGKTFLSAFGGFAQQHASNIRNFDELKADIAGGDLPAVAWIEPAGSLGLDEHPPGNAQVGAAFVAELVTSLMQGTHWPDSAMLISWDEAGGYFDHVPPPTAPHPDGIPPKDLQPTDTQADFDRYGFRVPLLVISPFAKKHYVSHTTADFTAFLRLIQRRFDLPTLTARDVAQADMTEFFDFRAQPTLLPPALPQQPVDGPCYRDRLP